MSEPRPREVQGPTRSFHTCLTPRASPREPLQRVVHRPSPDPVASSREVKGVRHDLHFSSLNSHFLSIKSSFLMGKSSSFFYIKCTGDSLLVISQILADVQEEDLLAVAKLLSEHIELRDLSPKRRVGLSIPGECSHEQDLCVWEACPELIYQQPHPCRNGARLQNSSFLIQNSSFLIQNSSFVHTL